MKRTWIRSPALLVVIATMMSGCATIISGTSQAITIESNPPGAFVTIGEQSGMTPVTLQVPKGKNYPVEVTRGRQRRVVSLNRELDPYTLLNIIPPFWPGFIVDAASGAISHYDPTVIFVDFDAERKEYISRVARFGW